jgi:hypothetical protein
MNRWTTPWPCPTLLRRLEIYFLVVESSTYVSEFKESTSKDEFLMLEVQLLESISHKFPPVASLSL